MDSKETTMKTEPLSRIETPTNSYVERYPQAIKAAIQQQNVFWAAEKMGVEADKSDFLTKLTDGEFHAVLLLQTILTQYELMIGGTEMWGGKIANMFPRPEIQRMCSEFSHAELCSHAPFYKEGNKVLNRDTDEFYEEWTEHPVLAKHVEYIEGKATSKCPLEVTAALCFLEGVVLFSAFAFFKSFNTNGFNLIPHFVSGIDASAKDENFHCMGSAWLFRTCLQERREAGHMSDEQELLVKETVYQLAEEARYHEFAIIDLLYEHKPETIRTVSKEDMKDFINDRVNVVLGYLDMEQKPIKKGKISEWFYDNISTYKYADFFASTQTQYQKNWDVSALTFGA